MVQRALGQRGHDGRPGGVRHVQDAPKGVAAFAGQVELIAHRVKRDAPAAQAVDRAARLGDRELDDLLIAKPGPGGDGVPAMGLDAVVRVGHRRYAALRPLGRTGLGAVLAEHGHPRIGC